MSWAESAVTDVLSSPFQATPLAAIRISVWPRVSVGTHPDVRLTIIFTDFQLLEIIREIYRRTVLSPWCVMDKGRDEDKMAVCSWTTKACSEWALKPERKQWDALRSLNYYVVRDRRATRWALWSVNDSEQASVHQTFLISLTQRDLLLPHFYFPNPPVSLRVKENTNHTFSLELYGDCRCALWRCSRAYFLQMVHCLNCEDQQCSKQLLTPDISS